MANSITLREFITKWGFEVDDKELEKLDSKFAKSRETMQKLSENIGQIGQKFSLFVTAPFIGFAGIATKTAADAADIQERYEKVFQSLGPQAVEAANQFGKAFGLSNMEAQKLLSTNGQLLKSLGFQEKQALDLATQVGTLSADLAEFNMLEGGAAEASDIIKQALAGRTMGLKQLGIVIDDDIIKQRVQANAAAGMTFKTLKQAEAYATLQAIQDKSKDATGAFANSQGDLGVQLQRMKATLTNIAVTFGKILLPPVQKVLGWIQRGIDWIDSFNDNTKTFILVIGGVVAAIGPLLLALSSVISVIQIIQTAMVIFGNASLLATAKFLALPLLIAAAVVGLGLIIEDIVAFFQGKDSVTGVIVEKFKEVFGWLEAKFATLPGWVQALVTMITTPFRAIMSMIRGVGNAAGALFKGDFKGAGAAILQAGEDAYLPVINAFKGKTSTLSETLGLGARDGQGTFVQSQIPPTQAGVSAGGQKIENNVTSPISITVPPGTPPDAVGPFVQKGVGDGLGQLLRETQRQTKTAVTN